MELTTIPEVSSNASLNKFPPTASTILVLATAGIGALFAMCRLLTTFAAYDDEGYLLLTLKHYLSEGHLYTQTFTEYGPFYYFAQWIFFRLLGFPLTHNGGRLVTLVYWLGSALFAALFARKLSKSLVLGCVAGLSCVIIGAVLATEPGHPQQVLLLLFMAASYFSLPWDQGRVDLQLFALGGIGAALAFTKINAGFFYVVALSHALLCLLKPGWLRSLGLSFAIVYAAAGPWMLLHTDFNRGIRNYCVFAILCGVATFAFGSLLRPENPQSASTLLRAVWGFLAVGLLTVVAALLQGISFSVLIQGVIVNASEHHNVFFRPYPVYGQAIGTALAVIIGLIAMWVLRGKVDRFAVGVDAARYFVGVTAVLLLLTAHPIDWLLPFLPLSLVPGTRQSFSAMELFPRCFVTDLAATQFLETYPVAGNQIAIAASPILLWAILCISDGLAGLGSQGSWTSFAQRAPLPKNSREAEGALDKVPSVSVIASALMIPVIVLMVASITSRLRHLPPQTALAGSSLLHLPPEQEHEYELIAHTVSANCSMLFTLPGMGSFNFWSGVPTPNGSNLALWTKAFDAKRQREIMDRLQSDPNACVLYYPGLLHVWNTSVEEAATVPLGRYIIFDMPKTASIGPYELHIHPERKSIWHNVIP